MKDREAFKILLAVVWMAVAGIGTACVIKPSTANTAVEQGQDKAQEGPVPFESTRENEGKRCEAKTYFGLRPAGSYEGYSAFCYGLQSKLITAARQSNLLEIREALKFGANPNLPVDDSFPPLQTAAASGHADAVRLLLNNGPT